MRKYGVVTAGAHRLLEPHEQDERHFKFSSIKYASHACKPQVSAIHPETTHVCRGKKGRTPAREAEARRTHLSARSHGRGARTQRASRPLSYRPSPLATMSAAARLAAWRAPDDPNRARHPLNVLETLNAAHCIHPCCGPRHPLCNSSRYTAVVSRHLTIADGIDGTGYNTKRMLSYLAVFEPFMFDLIGSVLDAERGRVHAAAAGSHSIWRRPRLARCRRVPAFGRA